MTPLGSGQVDSMLDNGHLELEGSTAPPSPGQRHFLSNYLYTTSEPSFENIATDEDLSSNQSNRFIHENPINPDMSVDEDKGCDTDMLQTTATGYTESGGHKHPREAELRNTPGSE